MEQEIWKDINGYEGLYQISNLGRLKSFKCTNIKILKPILTSAGYPSYFLRKNNIIKQYLLHRLLAISFIQNTKNKPCINHINGIRNDYSIENLEWCTQKENIQHAINVLGKHVGCRKSKKNKHKINYIKKTYFNIINKRRHKKTILIKNINLNSKLVLQYDLNMNFIKQWESISSIKREYNLKNFNISSVFNEYTNKVVGYYWKYKV